MTQKNYFLFIVLCCAWLCLPFIAHGQIKIGEGTQPIDGAVLDLKKTAAEGYLGGLLLPRVNITDLGYIPEDYTEVGTPPLTPVVSGKGVDTYMPLEGMVVFNTNIMTGSGVYVWTGVEWRVIYLVCKMTITPDQLTLPHTASHDNTITVSCKDGNGNEVAAAWTLTSNDTWLTLTLNSDGSGAGSTISGTGSQTVYVVAAAHLSLIERTTTISSSGITAVAVTQESVPPVFIVTGPATDYTYTGGSQNYSVTSYYDGGTIIPIPWEAEFSEDGGATWTTTKPSWLTTFTPSGAGGVAETGVATAAAFIEVVLENTEDKALKMAAEKGSFASPHDLSTKGGKTNVNTANCYIVNSPGWYQLPLVYGNAIKNGATNSSAYTSSGSGTGILPVFIRHDGAAITNPYIYNNGTTASDAVLIWMDAPDLVTNVRLINSNHSLAFEVPQSNILQGNAILAVRNSSKVILWSWHIWVTPLVDEENPNVLTVTGNPAMGAKQHDLMEYNLGWCTATNKQYGQSPRSVEVRISTTGSVPPSSQVFTVNQQNYILIPPGNNPFWQWGRKDPMPAIRTDKPAEWWRVYTNDSMYDFNKLNRVSSIEASIQNPHIVRDKSYYPPYYINLWSDNDDALVRRTGVYSWVVPACTIKTVYDPSPVGFKVPPCDAFSGTTVRVWANSPASEIIQSQGWSNGFTFDTTPDKLYLPASGLLAQSNAGLNTLWVFSGNGSYHTAQTRNTWYMHSPYHITDRYDEFAVMFSFHSGGAIMIPGMSNFDFIYAPASIRSVAEK